MRTKFNSEQMRADFHRDGYVFLRGFLTANEVAEFRQELTRLLREELPRIPGRHVYYEDADRADTLKQIQQLGEYSHFFRRWQHTSKFRDVAETLLEGPVLPKNMQYFNKPPGVGQPTPPHQDGFYFMLRPCEAVTMWLALDEIDEENGCVRYIRGYHKSGMRPHSRTETLGFSQGIVDFPTLSDMQREIALPAQPGDLLVHHALTVHRAEQNRSATRSRQAMGFIYYSERAQEDAAAHEAYQRALAEELAAAGKIKNARQS